MRKRPATGDLELVISRVARPISTATRPFVDGTPCCYCDMPVFGSQSPRDRGSGAWSHDGCRRGRPARGIPVPAGPEVASYVSRSVDGPEGPEGPEGSEGPGGLPAADVQCQVESWLYSFWLRRCPVWPAVVVRSGRPREVGALLDEVEDALDGCLWGSGQAPVRTSGEDLERSLVAVTARFGPVEVAPPTERPSDADDEDGVDEVDAFTAWLEEGHALGFIVWGD